MIIKCDNKKRIDWPLGRVIAVFPGKDNFIRVVKVKTAKGELTRAVQSVYPLEMSCNDELCEKSSDITKPETLTPKVAVTQD